MDWRTREHRRRNVHEPGDAHELTFSCYKKFAFLQADRTCEWLAKAINDARRLHHFDLWAFVFMADHVHLIIHPRTPEYPDDKILSSMKIPVARKGIAFLTANAPEWLEKTTRRRGNKIEHLFWQSGGGFDRSIKNGNALLEMIDYIHANPVRRGLVERPEDWKWSSAAWFAGGESPISLDPIPWEWLVDVKEIGWRRYSR